MSDETIDVVLIFGPDGSLQAGIPGGTTSERATPALREFMANLKLDKLIASQDGDVERHTHGPEELKVRADGRHTHQ
jgi:hypothetical protein